MKNIVFVLILALAAVAIARAEPMNRFWSSDWSDLGGSQHAYIVHDKKQPSRCVLVIQADQHNAGYPVKTVSAMPWNCE